MATNINQSDDRQHDASQASKATEQMAAHLECRATEASQLSSDDFWWGNDSLGG
jgi:hypothetical protein